MMLTLENILKVKNDFENRDMEGAQVMQINNPYTHLRTLLDDESSHEELCEFIWALTNNEKIKTNRSFARIPLPPYTTSLDALLPLWPEGWAWSVLKDENGYYEAKARKFGLPVISCNDQLVKTPALAMLDCLLQVLQYEWGGQCD